MNQREESLYYQKNRDKVLERARRYYITHRETILERLKEKWHRDYPKRPPMVKDEAYWRRRKENLKMSQRLYYEKNRERLLARAKEKYRLLNGKPYLCPTVGTGDAVAIHEKG